MSLLVTLNGSNYIIPETNEVGWGSNLDDYFVAIAAGVLQKTGGSFTLSAETDFGASYGLKSLYLKSRSSNVAASGILRLANNSDAVSWRNAANGADLALTVDASNRLSFNGTPLVGNTLQSAHIFVGNASNVATDVAVTGDIGIDNAGLTSITAGAIVNADVNASAAIAYTKLNLTASVVNADIAVAAAIAYSKLNLSGSIVNADVNAAAAIAYSKLNLAASIVNADVNASAAIAYSKLNLATSIVNADISASAAIAYSKLNLALGIVNADISASAAISRSKLGAGTAWRLLADDGSGVLTEIGFGSSGQVLTSAGATALPAFANVTGTGTVNSGTATNLAYYATSTNVVSNAGDLYYDATNHRFGINAAANRAFQVSAATSLVDTISRIDGPTGHYPILELTENNSTTAGQYWQIYKLPSTDGTNPHGLSIWNNGERLSITPSGQVLIAGNGSLTNVALGWIGDLNTGFNRLGADEIAAVCGGVLSLDITTAWIGVLDGTTSRPGVLFQNDPDSGLMRVGADDIALVTGGTIRQEINSVGLATLTNSNANGGALTLNNTGTRGPGMSFQKSGTGVGYIGASGWWLGSAATDFMIAAEAGGKIRHFYNGGVNSALDIDSTGKSTFNGNIAFGSPSTQGIVGSTTNDAAAAGNVGEVIESIVTLLTAVGTNGVFGDLTSISLTAGTWLITGVWAFSAQGATVGGPWEIGISTASGTSQTGLVEGKNNLQFNFVPTASSDVGATMPNYYVQLSGTTTHYLKCRSTYSAGAPKYAGRITAVRIR